MKLLFILILVSSCLKVRYCVIQTTYEGNTDTICMKVKGGLCIARYEDDTIPKLADKRGWILKDSVSDYKILKISKRK